MSLKGPFPVTLLQKFSLISYRFHKTVPPETGQVFKYTIFLWETLHLQSITKPVHLFPLTVCVWINWLTFLNSPCSSSQNSRSNNSFSILLREETLEWVYTVLFPSNSAYPTGNNFHDQGMGALTKGF